MKKMNGPWVLFSVLLATTSFARAEEEKFPIFGKPVHDEAFLAHAAGSFSDDQFRRLVDGSSEDYFQDMDYGITRPENRGQLVSTLSKYFPGITPEEAGRRMARGRNNWIVFTGGNDRFWTYLGRATLSGLDFLKTVSDEPSLPATRSNRWEELGLVNEPCFEKAAGPRADRWGLWLPNRSLDCAPADPFENEAKYPGVKIGARGTVLNYRGRAVNFPVGSSYGYASGVMGLRLFPNPAFDQKAADRWDPVRYYRDEAYYTDPKLVRPYRVGMACAFCHVGPNPSHPPADFNAPKWENLSSNPGAQYFWFDRIFYWNYQKHSESFVFQLLHTSRPGALDTSLVTSDQIVNPRTMNAIYDVPARIDLMNRFRNEERLTGDELRNVQFSSLPTSNLAFISPLRKSFDPATGTVLTPRVLKDGSDSVGMLGALNRVYVNIGLFSEEWLKHFIPLIGGPKITPFPLERAQTNSLYWQALVEQTPDVALFFTGASKPDLLANAPDGKSYQVADDSPVLQTGKRVFAENCAACHSSKLPPAAYGFFNRPGGCEGDRYATCWKEYWDYAHSPQFKDEMRKIVSEPDFLVSNFLSTDLRVPVTLLDSQLCSPIGTNAIKGNIWDNFSSSTYKSLSSVGDYRVNFPNADGSGLSNAKIPVPDGGRGYLRPPSLISLWSTAPFLQNNSLGRFDLHGTVAGRMSSFNDSIQLLLNPERRSPKNEFGKSSFPYVTQFGDTLRGFVDVTTQDSYLTLPRSYVPKIIREAIELAAKEETDSGGKMYAARPLMFQGPAIPREESPEPQPRKLWIARLFDKLFNKSKDAERQLASKEPTDEVYYQLGPIPAGVPINLIGNLNLDANLLHQGEAVAHLVRAVIKIRHDGLKGDAARKYFMEKASEPLLKVSKCTDFVVNRGHYFGTRYSEDAKNGRSTPLTGEEKAALVEYLKKF